MTEIVSTAPYNNPLLDRLDPPETIQFSDAFNRSDVSPPSAVSLGSTPVGAKVWQRQTSATPTTYGGVIAGDRLALVASSSCRAAVLIDTTKANGRLTAKFDSGTKDSTIALVFRYVDINNYLFVTVNGGQWWLYSRIAGTGASIGPSSGITAANGDIVDIYYVGTHIVVSINGVVRIEQTVTTFATATIVGIAQTLTGNTVGAPVAFWDDITYREVGSWAA